MSNVIYYTGDTVPFVVELLVGAEPEFLAPNYLITAGLVTNDGESQQLAGPWVVSKDEVGSDWPNGKIVVVVDGEQTTGLDTQVAVVEVQVEHGSYVRTFRCKPLVKILRGALPEN